MTVSEKIGLLGLVPVIVFDDVEDAVPTARALSKAGLPIMEITLRTEQGLSSIKKIKKECADILLGAGTVLSVEQAKAAVDAGSEFVVSPGFNDEVVGWCIENSVTVTPGCVTPTEIEHAMSFGLHVLKFFPAGIYGGIKGCKALYGPYRMVKFIPTGGVSLDTLADYADKSYIHAIGGGWLCAAKDIAGKDFDNIEKTVKASIDVLLGFEFDKADTMSEATVNNIDRAVFYLGNRGYETVEKFAKEALMKNTSTGTQLRLTLK